MGVGHCDGGGAGAGTSFPYYSARKGWAVDSLGAGGGAGQGRPALVSSWAGGNCKDLSTFDRNQLSS